MKTVLSLDPNDRILDAGCGTGMLLTLLKPEQNQRVVGIDLTFAMLKEAQTRLPGYGQLCQAKLQAIPYADGAFDWVICANSLHYLKEPLQAVSECVRVLSQRGHLVVLDWDHDAWAMRWRLGALRIMGRPIGCVISKRRLVEKLVTRQCTVEHDIRFRADSWPLFLVSVRKD